MCYAPITIKNNSKLYRPLVSKDLVKVPCGKCRECRLKAQNDWFVRIYYEWLETKSHGGQTFFITLTYNDYHLPYLDSTLSRYTPLQRFLEELTADRLNFHLNEVDKYEFNKRVERYFDRYDVSNFVVPEFKHNAFNDKHLVSFWKSLRQNLHNFGVLKYNELPIKYFCVTEYGDPQNTCRPHYHALVFVPKRVDADLFIKLCRRSWSYVVKKSDYPDYINVALSIAKSQGLKYQNVSSLGTKWQDWHLNYSPNAKRYIVHRQRGFVNYSNKGATLDNIQGCKYLTEYLNYYDSYLKDNGFDKLLDYIKLFPDLNYYSGYEQYKELLHELRMVFPFKRVSYNFGSSILKEFDNLTESDMVDKISQNEITIPNENRTYPIPGYILNRLLYTRESVPDVANPVVMFSELGYKVFKSLYDERIEQKVQMYQETLKVLKSFLLASDIEKFEQDFGYSISQVLGSPSFGFSLHNLARFEVVLNGVSVSHGVDILHLEDMSASDIIDNCYDIYVNQLLLRNKAFESPTVLFHDLYMLHIFSKKYLKERTYNALPQFDYFDKFLTVIDYIRNVVLTRDAQEQTAQYTSRTKVRDALNQFRFTN